MKILLFIGVISIGCLSLPVTAASTNTRPVTPPRRTVTQDDLAWKISEARLYYVLTCNPTMGATAQVKDTAYRALNDLLARAGNAPLRRKH
jgi:hypothetical protein